MSWEDCGFKPGKIHGPVKCPRGACSDCDGEHHFYAAWKDGDLWFECKHCNTWAETVPENDEEDAPYVCPGCHAIGGEPHGPNCIDAELEREREDERQLSLDYDDEAG